MRNKLISTYLATRRGNCVSMPILMLIIGERMGLDLALSTAPLHIFIRHREGGREVNLEATSGGHPARTECRGARMGARSLAGKEPRGTTLDTQHPVRRSPDSGPKKES